MKCFWCKDLLPNNLMALDLHCKIRHGSEHISYYICREGCMRAYGSLSSLKKHLRNVHKIPVYPAFESGMDFSSEIISSGSSSEGVTTEIHDQQFEAAVQDHPCFDSLNFEDLVKPLKTCVTSLLAKLSGDPLLPRSYVQKFISDVKEILSHTNIFSLKMIEILKNNSASEVDVNTVLDFFQFLQDPFKGLSTEYMRIKYFKSTDAYVPPKAYEIARVEVSKRRQGTVSGKIVTIYGQHISMPKMLTKFFELPDALSCTLEYIDKLLDGSEQDDCVYNFIQSASFKAKREKYEKDDIVLPVFVFFDDLELNKELGPHSKKIGGVYVKLPCLPPECQAVLSNIFVSLLFLSKYRTADFETQKKVFKPLIDDLIFLEKNGILVNTPVGVKRIYFVVGLILGDNVGLNSIGGFVASFSKACFMCRRCKVHKFVLHTQCSEDVTLLRNVDNFLDDVKVNNYTLTGVKDDCPLRAIPSLSFPQDLSVDPLHDLDEGICHNILIACFDKFVPKYFTLATLNDRIRVFDFGPLESNKIPLISENFSSRDKFKMTGSEMTCFVKLISLVIGDLVPESDEYWELYLKLREVVDIVKAKAVPKNIGRRFNLLISELNSMYIRLTQKSLTLKGHVFVHYGSFLDRNGPVDHVSTIRFEAKHRDISKPASSNMSRTDICYSSAVKHQLAFAYKVLAGESILPKTTFGPIENVNLTDFDMFDQLKGRIPPGFVSNEYDCIVSNWVNIKGTKYFPGCVLFLKLMESSKPIFVNLEHIICNDNYETLFITSYLVNLGFNCHVHAYHVTETSCKQYSIVDPVNLMEPIPLHAHRMATGELYVTLRHMF